MCLENSGKYGLLENTLVKKSELFHKYLEIEKLLEIEIESFI